MLERAALFNGYYIEQVNFGLVPNIDLFFVIFSKFVKENVEICTIIDIINERGCPSCGAK